MKIDRMDELKNVESAANVSSGGQGVASGGRGGSNTSASDLNYSIPGILHFLQHEWSRFEMERGQWEVERAELQVSYTTAVWKIEEIFCHQPDFSWNWNRWREANVKNVSFSSLRFFVKSIFVNWKLQKLILERHWILILAHSALMNCRNSLKSNFSLTKSVKITVSDIFNPQKLISHKI